MTEIVIFERKNTEPTELSFKRKLLEAKLKKINQELKKEDILPTVREKLLNDMYLIRRDIQLIDYALTGNFNIVIIADG